MTPYVLRFEIFKQAYAHANDEYIAAYNIIDNHNNHNLSNEKKWDYPSFPSYERIEALADKINSFVSSK